jgi:hypothetical protein
MAEPNPLKGCMVSNNLASLWLGTCVQERIKLLLEERKKLLDGGDHLMTSSHSRAGLMGSGTSTMDVADTSAMIEKEKHKLEVLKRRQERDIQQVSQG